MTDLAERGRGERESGAFLLARKGDAGNTVHAWITYEMLDEQSLQHDYIRLDSRAFTRLWAHCDARNLTVVGDVHTHPLGPRQSPSDRQHPMIALAGHVALVVPQFAIGDPRPEDVSFNVYLGGGRWASFYGPKAAARILLY